MFQKYFLPTLVFLFATSANAQWIKSSSYPNANFFDVDFPDINAAYAIGDLGSLCKSTDGGITWSEIYNFGPFSSLRDVRFFNVDTGFVNANFAQMRTFDGGSSWTSIGDFTKIKICQDFLYTSYTSNGTTYIQKSTDYGDTWTVLYQHSEVDAKPYLVSFVDSKNAYFINPNKLDRVYKTTDGFLSISTVFITTGDLFLQNEYDFKDLTNGYLYGSWGSQSHPTRTWNTGTFYFPINLDSFGVLPVLDLDFSTSKLYASSLYGKIFMSVNNGHTWTPQYTSTDFPISSISFLNENMGIAVSHRGIFYTTNGGLEIKEHKQTSLMVYPNPTNEILHLRTGKHIGVLSGCIFDNLGKKIKSFSGTKTIDVSGLNAGLYFLQLKTTDGDFYEKIVVE